MKIKAGTEIDVKTVNIRGTGRRNQHQGFYYHKKVTFDQTYNAIAVLNNKSSDHSPNSQTLSTLLQETDKDKPLTQPNLIRSSFI